MGGWVDPPGRGGEGIPRQPVAQRCTTALAPF